jgi:hypothetical protein
MAKRVCVRTDASGRAAGILELLHISSAHFSDVVVAEIGSTDSEKLQLWRISNGVALVGLHCRQASEGLDAFGEERVASKTSNETSKPPLEGSGSSSNNS